jgi:hypothetical protein
MLALLVVMMADSLVVYLVVEKVVLRADKRVDLRAGLSSSFLSRGVEATGSRMGS